MKIKPVISYDPTSLPTKQEVDDSPLLLSMPGQDSGNWVSRLAGGGLALSLLLRPEPAQATAGAAPEITQAPPGTIPDKKPEQPIGNFDVAPLLEEALSNDGRGAFGCMAINPPSFLSEAEAVDIIRKHLTQAGLKFSEQPICIEGPIAMTDQYGGLYRQENRKKDAPESEFDRLAKGVSLNQPVRGDIQFDLATDDGTVLIEYLSNEDYRSWDWLRFQESRGMGMGSSLSGYNFADLAGRFTRFMADEPDREKRTVGIFFDPLVRVNSISPRRPKYPIPPPKQEKDETSKAHIARFNQWYAGQKEDAEYQARFKEWQAECQRVVRREAGARLVLQLDHFINRLREKGTLPR